MGKTERDSKTGLPGKSPYPPGINNIPSFYMGINGVELAVGQAFAHAVYTFGQTSEFQGKISTIAAQGLGWMYMGMTVWRLANVAVAINLGSARFKAKISNPDQHVYKVYGSGENNSGYVLMEEEGAIGEFNRAQRAHMVNVEGSARQLSLFFLASFVFPLPTFICACLCAFSRIQSCLGYVKSADSRMSMLGMFGNAFMDGLVLYAAWRALAIQLA
mmetsp:Transcript_38826/g.97245  ORF Transcript_38826/g.97245 Transcript_38826/m.97245 type:complete len:217 (-) Transcript_38826:140-790(-)|eukprot:CAMPEP_0173418176 /NCGR_PEP_ID=MMETSP1357-20121228/394_1 /TAXON_ID=77926 /ORGANISM="Hemiselmis rufescens, Strain PCC563" /LENGTH=216 /DNA_ID=CAMNT_0014380623 /DNA_START=43 /DNA_END=693 /DNA_ORIENTATION=+